MWMNPFSRLSTTAPARLPMMPKLGILMHMRTTVNIDDTMIENASRLTGIAEKPALMRREALIGLESSRRPAELGRAEKNFVAPPRRRDR